MCVQKIYNFKRSCDSLNVETLIHAMYVKIGGDSPSEPIICADCALGTEIKKEADKGKGGGEGRGEKKREKERDDALLDFHRRAKSALTSSKRLRSKRNAILGKLA